MQSAECDHTPRARNALQTPPEFCEPCRGAGQRTIEPAGDAAQSQEIEPHCNDETACDGADDHGHPGPHSQTPTEGSEQNPEVCVDNHPTEVVQQMLAVETIGRQLLGVETHERSAHTEAVRTPDESKQKRGEDPPAFDRNLEALGVRRRKRGSNDQQYDPDRDNLVHVKDPLDAFDSYRTQDTRRFTRRPGQS